MDDFERRVLRQKRGALAEHVDLSEDLLRAMKRAHLINEDMLQGIKSEKLKDARAALFVEFVTSCPVQAAFDHLTAALMTDYAWLAKELQADLKAQRGNLEIDDDVMKEAGMLVHRQFGTSKRLSELDKKEMQQLIAVKIQISKEEWKDEIEVFKQEVKDLEHIVTSEARKAKEVDKFVKKFIKEHEAKLVSRALGKKSTSDILRTVADDGDTLAILQSRLDLLTSRCKNVLEERDLMFEERELCFRALGARDDSVPLHDIIKNRAAEFPNAMKKCQDESEEKEKIIRRLRKLLTEYETELEENDNKVKGIRDELNERREREVQFQEQIKELMDENSELKAKLEAKEKKKSRKSSARNGAER